MNKKLFIIIGLSAVILALIAVVVYFSRELRQSQQNLAEFEEIAIFEKEMLEEEFERFSMEFNNFPTTIHNDSLVRLLDEEKMRVQQLLEELRVTKATNRRRILELERELSTVREVMRSYIVQIDSLNRENTRLTQENREVRQQANVANARVEILSREREVLTETVARASQLDVTNFSFTGLNNRNRPANRAGQLVNLQFNYTISKNITTPPGMKTIFLRITRPDGEVMTKSPDNLFPFENGNIAYSSRHDFEYEGETMNVVIFWKVDEILQVGTYRADFFIDGNHVGRFNFEIRR
jgi:hypothetical protein